MFSRRQFCSKRLFGAEGHRRLAGEAEVLLHQSPSGAAGLPPQEKLRLDRKGEYHHDRHHHHGHHQNVPELHGDTVEAHVRNVCEILKPFSDVTNDLVKTFTASSLIDLKLVLLQQTHKL